MTGESSPYFSLIAERFWKEEIILEPCEKCMAKRKCFSAFETSNSKKTSCKAFEEIRHCKVRNRILQEKLCQI